MGSVWMEDKVFLQKKESGNIQSSLEYFLKFNISKNAKILDIGCNYGSLIYNIYREGYKNVRGIDISKEAIKIGKKEYKLIEKKLEVYDGYKIPFKNESFDVVLMFDVIEHIPNAERFIKEEVYRIIKKGGLFIFQTPNKIMNIPWEIINQRSFTKWKEYHCSLQTYWSLQKLLMKSGFKEIKIEKYNILTEHNKNKVKRKLGFIGLFLLYFSSVLPLSLNPNFFGNARK